MKKYIILTVFSIAFSVALFAQANKLTGIVLGTDGQPVEGAIISFSTGMASAVTDKNGTYSLEKPVNKCYMKIVATGFYSKEYPMNEKVIPEKIFLIPVTEVMYNGLVQLPDITLSRQNKSTGIQGVEKKDMKKGFTIDMAIQDEIPGLRVVNKSGMPGEGTFMNLRGIHSIVAGNNPLIVINGVPYIGNEEVSKVISGYSRGQFFGYNTQDIRNVTVLKGAEAALYGSLGSNGVILIETEQATSDNLETKISFSGQYGISMPNRTIPVLGVSDYKTYLQDIGMTRYSMISSLHTDYPFLQNNDNYYSYLFNNNTNWIKEIHSPSFVTDNVFRVEGGDEIAKYNISFGYNSVGGVLGETKTSSYHTLINSNIMVSRDIDIFTNVGLYYINSNLQEQGMEQATNPIISAYNMMPLLSPFSKEPDGNILSGYSKYNAWNVNRNPSYAYDNVSNPLAIINTLRASDKIYDANIRLGINYRMNRYLSLNGLLNIYYNYTEETTFIPGVTNKAILPLYYNTGLNTVRKGVMENITNYYGLNANYNRTFDGIHEIKARAGVRYINTSLETDLASGYNSANDFYENLGSFTDHLDIKGTNSEWKWLNYNLQADYTYNHLLKTTLGVAVDGSSVSGVDTNRFGLFPSLGLTFMAANTGSIPEVFDLLNVNAEISRSGNSRFSSNYAKNYYQNSNFFNLGTITRSNVPNTKLQWEKKDQLDLGFDISMFRNKLNLQFNWFTAKSFDLLLAREISSVYGSRQYYDNVGEISTNGLETSISISPIRTKDFEWVIGASLANAASVIKSLGNSTELATSFEAYNGDDAIIMLKEGEAPYQFFGYQTDGIFNTSVEAASTGLTNIYGKSYQAGDVRFVDQNGDKVINAKDKVLLGKGTPDFFGALNTSLKYKNVSLLAEFGYSVGNKSYNAVRRNCESMSHFYNQSESVLNRWQMEGQKTTMPRAAYGDPSGNNLFSDRWIEDASYLKMRSLTLSYKFNETLFSFCRSGEFFIVAENLFSLTDYLGSDPEFSYSNDDYMQGFDYAKVSLPKTVKLGFSLYF